MIIALTLLSLATIAVVYSLARSPGRTDVGQFRCRGTVAPGAWPRRCNHCGRYIEPGESYTLIGDRGGIISTECNACALYRAQGAL